MLKSTSPGEYLFPNAKVHDGARFIFVHVTKTAGVAIKRSLQSCGIDIKTFHQTVCDRIQANGPDVFSAYPGYAVVRDPLDRIVSAYYYGKERNKDGWPEHDHLALQSCKDFTAFCHAVEDNRTMDSLLICKPQTAWVCDSEGNIPVELWPYDRVQGFWKHLCRKHDIRPLGRPLRRVNTSRHPHFLDCHSKETIAITYRVYEQDAILYEELMKVKEGRAP